MTEARERLDQAVRQKRVADDDLISKKAGESQSKAAQSLAVYENAQSREQTATGQAQRLGAMSRLDHAAALNAKNFVDLHGYGAASQEQKASLDMGFTEYSRQKKEELGSQLATFYEKASPGGEFRPGGLAAARKETDAARSNLMGDEDTARFADTVGRAKAIEDEFGKLSDAILNRISQEIAKVRNEAIQRNNGNQ